MLPFPSFPVSRDDRASMAAEAGVADVGRESKGFQGTCSRLWRNCSCSKHVETTGQSNFYAAMVGHGIDRSKFCTMMSIATDVLLWFRSEKGGGTWSISSGLNEIASSGQVTRGTPHKVFEFSRWISNDLQSQGLESPTIIIPTIPWILSSCDSVALLLAKWADSAEAKGWWKQSAPRMFPTMEGRGSDSEFCFRVLSLTDVIYCDMCHTQNYLGGWSSIH